MREGNQPLAESLVASGIAKSRFDTVRDRLDQLDAAISNRLDQIRTSVDDGRVRTAQAFVVTVLMALAVTAVAAVLVRRWIMVPLASLTAAVRRIRSGLPAAVTPQGPPELRQVATAVDEMQRTISQQRDDAIRAREAIEQSAILARAGALRARRRSRRLPGRLDHGRWASCRGGHRRRRLLRRLTDLADHHRHRRPRHRGSRRAERSRRAQVQGAAEGRAPFRPRAGSVAVVAERAGAWPRRALPHRVHRGPRHCERPRHLRERGPPARDPRDGSIPRTARADRPDRGPVRHDLADRVDGRRARGQADHLHRRPRRSPRPRSSLLRRDAASWTCSRASTAARRSQSSTASSRTSTTSTRGASPTTSPSSSPAAPGPTM